MVELIVEMRSIDISKLRMVELLPHDTVQRFAPKSRSKEQQHSHLYMARQRSQEVAAIVQNEACQPAEERRVGNGKTDATKILNNTKSNKRNSTKIA